MTVQLDRYIAEAYRSVHCDIREHAATHYWLAGGRGSGKSTFTGFQVLLLLLRNPDANAVVLRKVAKTLRKSVYAQVMWAIAQLGLTGQFKATTSPMEITYLATGQKIVFEGLDQPEKLKSIKFQVGYPAVVWYEEVDQFGGMEEIRHTHQSLLRGADKFWVFYTFNPPRSRENWANHEITIDRADRVVHTSDYRDIPRAWLGEQFYAELSELIRTDGKTAEQIERDMRAYRHEYLGEAVGLGGNVFENVVLREITDAEIAALDQIHNGVDWGWFPDAWAFVRCAYQSAQRRVLIIDEATGHKLSNEQSAAIVIDRLSDANGNMIRQRVTCDGAEPKSIANYRATGIDARAAVKGPGSVDHGMKWLASRAEIVIDPKRSPVSAREFSTYEHEKTRDGEWISSYPDADNHCIDAVRYALEHVSGRRHNV